MKDGPSIGRIQELFGDDRNADAFRLAILGFARIEDNLNAGLAEAFDGELPPDIRNTPFKVRVALAVALNLLPPDFKGPLGRLADIRNRFAHGKLEDLIASDAKQLYAALRELAPDVDEFAPSLATEQQPEIQLASLLMAIDIGMSASFEDAFERRAHEAQVVQEWRGNRRGEMRGLTPAEIQQLLSAEQE